MRFGALFIEEMVAMESDVCSKREPSSAPRWADAVHVWQRLNRTDLDTLHDLATTIHARIQEPEAVVARNQMERFDAFRAQAIALPIYGVAVVNDRAAQILCSGLLAKLSDERWMAATVQDANAAATAFSANSSTR